MSDVDSVQKYLDDIYPSAATVEGISVRLGLQESTVNSALKWLIKHRRAVEIAPTLEEDGFAVPGVVQYQSTKSVRAASLGFDGSIDS